MTIEQAKGILRNWDDCVWRERNHITMGDISDAIQLAEEALSNPWHKASEELPNEKGMYLVWVLDYLHPITMCFGDYGWDNSTGEEITHWMEIPELPKED